MADRTQDVIATLGLSVGQAHAESPKARAKAIFKQAQKHYRAKRYVEALNGFQEAYRIFPRPVMIYNSAKSYEKLNLLPQALKSYESFLATGKDKRGKVAKTVGKLKAKLVEWTEVLITSDPAGAEVRLYDARLPSLGETPLSIKMPRRVISNSS